MKIAYVRTGGEVKNWQIFAYVLYGWPLRLGDKNELMSVTFSLQNDLRFECPLRHHLLIIMKSVILGFFFHKLSETAFVLGLGRVSRVVGYPKIFSGIGTQIWVPVPEDIALSVCSFINRTCNR